MQLISIYYKALYDCRTTEDFVELYEYVDWDSRIDNDEFNRWEREFVRCYEEEIGEPILTI